MTIPRDVFAETLKTWKGEGAAIFEQMMKALDAGEEVLIEEPEGWNSKLMRTTGRGLMTTPMPPL